MQITEQFILANPGTTVILVLFMIGVIKLLITILSKLIAQPYNNLTKAIEILTKTIADVRQEIKENREQDRKDREKDRHDIGKLQDRMQAQETVCKTIQHYCPMNHPVAEKQLD